MDAQRPRTVARLTGQQIYFCGREVPHLKKRFVCHGESAAQPYVLPYRFRTAQRTRSLPARVSSARRPRGRSHAAPSMGGACGKPAPAAEASPPESDEDVEPVLLPQRVERRVSEPQAPPVVPSAAPRDAGGAAAALPPPSWPNDAAPDAFADTRVGSATDVARSAPRGAAARLRWQRGELLGTGAFGRVYLGLNEETGELLAVKEVLLSGGTMAKAAEQLRALEAEVVLLRTLSHPNIVRYIGTERTPEVRSRRNARRPARQLCWLRGSESHAPSRQPSRRS